MLNVIPVFDSASATAIRQRLEQASWVDGKVTAGHQSARSKHNLQLDEADPVARELGEMVMQALGGNAEFHAKALPQAVFPPLFNRYEGGGRFGTHVDNALRQHVASGRRIRTDLSATLFFSEPGSYDGGELVIEDTYGEQRIKLPAGHMVLYPSSSLHRVEPVTRGARISAFFWLQSLVRDDGQRRLLLELDESTRQLATENPDHPVAVKLTGIYHNLLRRWAEP